MTEEIYLYLLFLCGFWYQGIIGTFADEDIKKSSDFLDRQKRVVSYVPGEDVVQTIHDVGYVVAVKYSGRIKCTGNILSLHVVITAFSCTSIGTPLNYQVASTSSRTDRGISHNVIDMKWHINISLLIVSAHFTFSFYCYHIEIHNGPLLAGTTAKVSGWGYNYRNEEGRGTVHPDKLRSIEVPIISHQECKRRYRPYLLISEREICTYDPQRHCGHNDQGAGLIINNTLAGIFIQSGLHPGSTDSRYPDIFVVLQESDYRPWIRSNLHSIEENFHYGRYLLHTL